MDRARSDRHTFVEAPELANVQPSQEPRPQRRSCEC